LNFYPPFLCRFLAAILKMANILKRQNCSSNGDLSLWISSKFDMWVDNDVPNWFQTLKNFYRSPFSKWAPQYRTNSTLSDFNNLLYWICSSLFLIHDISPGLQQK
jgi:hypothetical protein